MESSGISRNESSSNVKIEHLPWLDVVLNLDYPAQEDFNIIIDLIKKKGPPSGPLSFSDLPFDLTDDEKFFIKRKPKSTSQRLVNFALGRSKDDPIDKKIARDFDHEARYARASILNEITLSPRVKKLVSSSAFQQLAKKYGFVGMGFSEPIAGIVGEYDKYLVYRNIKDIRNTDSFWELLKMNRFAHNLRKLFIANGIVPHDLRQQQFLITERNGERFLYLVDIEAYIKAR